MASHNADIVFVASLGWLVALVLCLVDMSRRTVEKLAAVHCCIIRPVLYTSVDSQISRSCL